MCIYRDYCVCHYKSTELVSLYTLDLLILLSRHSRQMDAPFHSASRLLRQTHAWDAVSNSYKYNILAETQFLHKTATLIYVVNRKSLLTTYLGKGCDAILLIHHHAIEVLN